MNFFRWLFQKFTRHQQQQKEEEQRRSEDPIRVQYAQFVQQFTLEKQLALFDKESYLQLSESQWQFQSDEYRYHKLQELFKNIKTATCFTIKLRFYQIYQNLPKNLCIPHFAKLRHLVINECDISSIESLSFIDAPQMIKVLITVTYVSILKPFDKIYWPKLEHLRFRFNQVQSCLDFGRAITSKIVDFMSIEESQNNNGSLVFVKAMFQTTCCLDLKKRLGEGNESKLLKALCRKLDIKNKD